MPHACTEQTLHFITPKRCVSGTSDEQSGKPGGPANQPAASMRVRPRRRFCGEPSHVHGGDGSRGAGPQPQPRRSFPLQRHLESRLGEVVLDGAEVWHALRVERHVQPAEHHSNHHLELNLHRDPVAHMSADWRAYTWHVLRLSAAARHAHSVCADAKSPCVAPLFDDAQRLLCDGAVCVCVFDLTCGRCRGFRQAG